MKFLKTPFYLCLVFILTTSFNLSENWFNLVSTEFSYQIEFPSKPTASQQVIDSDIGQLELNINMLDLSKSKDSQNLIYMSNCTVYPKKSISSEKKELIEDFFNGAINGAVKNVKGKLISSKIIQHQEYPGRYIKIDFKNGLAIITMKMILVKNKMYMLQTITETKKDLNKNLSRFMNSFKLLQ